VAVTLQKLSSTDAFVVIDLDGAPATGVVRAAPKILQGGAEDMARSLTYAFAAHGFRRSGASAGINATPDTLDDAVAAFVAELLPQIADGTLAIEAAKGVDPEALAELTAADDRSELAAAAVDVDGIGSVTLADHLAGLGPVLAAAKVLGGLDAKRVVIEGFGDTGAILAAAAVARGATVVAVSTAKGAMVDDNGLDPATLAAAWAESGDAMVGDDADPAWKVFATPADVLFCGSKMGAVDHQTAERLKAATVVPHAPLPYTAKALAVMGRADIVAVADFIPTGAPIHAWYPDGAATPDAIIAAATTSIESALDHALGHEHGPFLGACMRAEEFLRTWRDSLPFGRPLAS
jgi:glutamate dehydrogenase (NAD(P)+)